MIEITIKAPNRGQAAVIASLIYPLLKEARTGVHINQSDIIPDVLIDGVFSQEIRVVAGEEVSILTKWGE